MKGENYSQTITKAATNPIKPRRRKPAEPQSRRSVYVVVGQDDDDDFHIEVYADVENATVAHKKFQKRFGGFNSCLASRCVLQIAGK